MAVFEPPFSIKNNISSLKTSRNQYRISHVLFVFSAFLIFYAQFASTAKTNDCALLGPGGCRGQGWDNGEWPILVKGQRSLNDCCKECTKKKGCSGFHIGKLKDEKGDCFLFSHTAIVPVKSLGGECYQLKRGKSAEDDDDDDGPTEEQCKKYVTKACQKESAKEKDKKPEGNANKKHEKPRDTKVKKEVDDDDDEDDDSEEEYKRLAAKLKEEKAKDKQKEKKVEEKKKDTPDTKQKSESSDKVKKDEVGKQEKEQKKDDDKKVDEKKPPSKPKADSKSTIKDLPSNKEQKQAVKDDITSSKPKSALKEPEKKTVTKSNEPAKQPLKEEKKHKSNEGVVGKKEKTSDKPKAAKKIDTGPKQYDGKYLTKIGIGGCRGKNWNTKNCPKFSGRKTLDQCATECRKSDFCTAFHILKPEKDQTFDCLLFSHKEVIAVTGLGGVCYTFSDNLPQQEEDDEAGIDDHDAEEEEDAETEYSGPVTPLLLGTGFCRGPKWTFQKWPIPKGRLTLDDCAEECAKKKGCTAFDVSEQQKDKFDCLLYGHKGVVPATGVSKFPAKCYVLKGSPLSKLLDEEDIAATNGESVTLDDEEDEDQDEDIGEVGYTLLGKGMCRGPKWQSRKWPKSKGLKTINQCAAACLKKEGCRAFDMSPPDSRRSDSAASGKLWCNLYSNKGVKPASGVPGNCYKVQKDESELMNIPEDEEMVIDDDVISVDEVDDSILSSIPMEGEGFRNLGKGLCRGPNWQDARKIWPKDEGKESFEDCLKECKKDKGCTAFDVSPVPNSMKLKCMLFGHQDVKVASATSLLGRCVRMTGRQALSSSETPTVATGEGFVSLGKGLCRGTNWQTMKGRWPIDKGMKTLKECFKACEGTGGCTAFDIRDPDGKKKYHCYLFNHRDIIPASALSGTCYKMTGPIAVETGDGRVHYVDTAPDGLTKLGDGPCRGQGWQIGNKWPVETGFASTSQCGEACGDMQGCTAFDVRESDDDKGKTVCTLYGHSKVIPATGVSKIATSCYASPSEGFVASKPQKIKVKEAPKKPKEYKIPEFKEPKVIKDEDVVSDDDDEWLFEPPPPEVRSRDHINDILQPDAPSNAKLEEKHLKGVKKIYENSIKPLEGVYKYKELSNRHFGDPEIFNKPLIVMMGPWSGGKSTMINYILGTEYTKNAFRAAAEPSPGFNFNIAMYGEQDEELDGTELAAEFELSSLQKFGQEFLKKLRGKKMNNKLLQKATFAEIPGVLETGSKRKVDRRYPFNEAVQWFIDHADLILLVYDYTKLDIGPETEALLDQLKGRETQVRILLNKADEITAEELLKIQGNLVWNVSPLMSSLEPPTLYAGSFWSHPYKEGAPKKLLKAQERSLLKDIKEAIDKRVINRIATARRFAVRVRNHAKMVDCYLTTYNNKKGMFGNKKKIVDDIVQSPEKYHIYEGISSMTNISRFDLPDPDTYKTFFGLHPLPDFQTLQSTCEYFKGCPINKLDMAIAYELPEALTAFKRESFFREPNEH